MKKAFARIASFVLALLMVSGALVACSGGEDNPSDTQGNKDATTGNTVVTGPLPDMTFGEEGEPLTFRFAVRGIEGNNNKWDNTDVIRETPDGDQVDVAIYQRNEYMRTKYNVEIDVHFCGDTGSTNFGSVMSNFIHNNAESNDIEIDAIMSSPYDTIGYAIDGLIVDLNDVKYLDFSKDWWDGNVARDLTFGDKIYMMAGDFSIVDNMAVHAYLFNKELAIAYQLPDLYQLVAEKQWTIAKLIEYSEKALANDGDGDWDKDDYYGFIYWQDAATTFITSSGQSFAKYDSDGKPVMNLDDDAFISVWEKAIEITKSQWAYSRKTHEQNYGDDGHDLFYTGGKILFSWEAIWNAIEGRKIAPGMQFGIIPAPMYDEKQGEYMTTPHVYGYTMLSIPVPYFDSQEKLDNAGFILEAFTAKSKELVTPAFYELVLKTKTAEDPESAAMLDIIYSNIRYDVGNFMNFADCINGILTLFNTGNAGIGRWYQIQKSSIDMAIREVIALYE